MEFNFDDLLKRTEGLFYFLKTRGINEIRNAKRHFEENEEFETAALCQKIEENHKDYIPKVKTLLLEFDTYDNDRYGYKSISDMCDELKREFNKNNK